MNPGQSTPVITKLLALLLLLTAGSVVAQTNSSPPCCRYPLRTLARGEHVNLSPLFEWWIRQGGQSPTQTVAAAAANYYDPRRPLRAWKRVTGRVTAEQPYGWVMEAEVADHPGTHTNEWLVLQHPPVAEAQRFYQLKAQLAEAETQIEQAQQAHDADLKKAEKADARALREATAFSKYERRGTGSFTLQAQQDRAAAAAALAEAKHTEQIRAQIQRQLDALPAAEGNYKIDCFALEVGRNARGQLIFDAGMAAGYTYSQ